MCVQKVFSSECCRPSKRDSVPYRSVRASRKTLSVTPNNAKTYIQLVYRCIKNRKMFAVGKFNDLCCFLGIGKKLISTVHTKTGGKESMFMKVSNDFCMKYIYDYRLIYRCAKSHKFLFHLC